MTFSRSCFCVCSLLVLFTVGCAESKTEPWATGIENETQAARKGTIGFSALTLTNPFFKVIAESLTEEAAKHGYEVVVVSGDQDVKKQSDQIDDFIIIDTALHDNVDLYWRETGGDCGIDAIQHVLQLVASRHLEKPLLL